nr:hypothetical protein [Vogesella sp.]
ELESGQFLIQQQLPPAQAQLLVAQPRAYWHAPMCMVVWRGHPQAAELVRRFNRELAAMKRSGELARLLADSRRRVFLTQP